MNAEPTDKLILEVWDGIDLRDALKAALRVVEMGRISETSKGKQHCFATVVRPLDHPPIAVWVDKNRKSERFVIQKDA